MHLSYKMKKDVALTVKFIALLVYNCGSILTWTWVWNDMVYLCVKMSACVCIDIFFILHYTLRVNIKENIAMSFLFAGSR